MSSTEMSDLDILMEMGFPQTKAEKALSMTGNKGVEAAMEWLIVNSESMESSSEKTDGDGGESGTTAEAQEIEGNPVLSEESLPEAKSIKCDVCNRKFRTDSEIEFHAVKSGHQTFSQCAEEIKPLSEEEKREQVKKNREFNQTAKAREG